MKPLKRRTIHDDISYWIRLVAHRIQIPGPISLKSAGLFLTSCLVALLVIYFVQDRLSQEATLMAGIFTLAALLWATGALPLFATSLLIIGLEIILLANRAIGPGLALREGRTLITGCFLHRWPIP